MPTTPSRQALIELFKDTSEAHQAAFSKNQQTDPDWSIWYAMQLQQPLEQLAGMPFAKSRLIYCLMNAENEWDALAQPLPWEEFAADRFIECYAESEQPNEDRLALYYMVTCPYCQRVMRVIRNLGIDVEMRSIIDSDDFRNELVTARGRATVPVLRIDSPDGTSRWMPESRDIMAYLEKTYG